MATLPTYRVKDYERENYIETHIYEVRDFTPRNRNVNKEKQLTNLATSRRKIIELLLLNMTIDSTFLTLTYANNEQDYEKTSKDFIKFIKKLNYRLGIKLSYLGVKELQSRGAIHYHILIFSHQFRDLTIEQLSNIWGHGFIYSLPIKNFHVGTYDAVSNYFSKYLSNYIKGQIIARDKKLFFTSKNIIRSKVVQRLTMDRFQIIKNGNIITGNRSMTKVLTKKKGNI